jgi:hypothetical protein
MQDGAKTLARVWEAAWRAGSGEDRGQGGLFNQGDLRKLYDDPRFLPAFPLQQLTVDATDHLVPIGGSARRAAPSSARRVRPRPAKKAAASKRPVAKAVPRRAAAKRKTAAKRKVPSKRKASKRKASKRKAAKSR